MKNYERDNIKKMSGYVPGEQPASIDVVKLNTNENPYPPANAVMEALQGIDAESLRRYPPPTATKFREAAAGLHGLSAENIIAVNGGDELLRLAITTFVDPGQPVGIADPSYGLYRVLPAIQDCPVVSVPLAPDWSLPDDMAEKMNDAQAKLVIITNPHAPSGLLTDVGKLVRVAEKLHGLLLIDEAYVDFVDPDLGYDSVQIVRRLDNVMILRSFSKGYSLAGLRFGYGIGPAYLIEPILTKTRDSYNVDAISQRLATAALESRDEAAKTWVAVRTERVRMISALKVLGLNCRSSQSNFLLATVPEYICGGAYGLYSALKDQNIFVRYFNEDRLRDKIRITVGKPQENDVLLSALKSFSR